jgi:hypothetical protein
VTFGIGFNHFCICSFILDVIRNIAREELEVIEYSNIIL